MDKLENLYGSCKLDYKCLCLQPIKRTSPIQFPLWLGRLCPNWQPDLGAINAIREIYNKTDVN